MKQLISALGSILLIVALTLLILFVMDYSARELVEKRLSSIGTYEVTYVFDGDTIEVKMDGVPQKVRLIGVNTPETGGHDTQIECYGYEAGDYTRSLLENQRVRLEADPLSTNRDRYDRLLRYAYRASDDLDVNKSLIEDGYSRAYSVFPFERSAEFSEAATEAERARRGLYSAC